MLGRTHLVVGLFFALLSLLFYRPENLYLFFIFAMIGSLLPDIDRQSSYIGRFFPNVSAIFKHRGFFHSFYSMIMFSIIIFYLTRIIYVFVFFICFLSHLILDSFTKKGISFFLFDKKLKGGFVSGGIFDLFLLFLFLSLDIILVLIL